MNGASARKRRANNPILARTSRCRRAHRHRQARQRAGCRGKPGRPGADSATNALLSLFPAGVGQACMGRGGQIPDHPARCAGGVESLRRRTRRELLSRAFRPAHAAGEEVLARDGRAWPRAASVRRHRGAAPAQGHLAGADAQPAHRERHDMEPSHGDTAFTVPLFDQFMHRIMPGDDWRT